MFAHGPKLVGSHVFSGRLSALSTELGPRSGFIYSFSATHALAEGSGQARRHKR
jgi:hypothetical protein